MNFEGEVLKMDIKLLPKVSKISIDGRNYYLKKNIDKKLLRKKLLFFIQKVVSKILFFRILSPTANIKNNSNHEAIKLVNLKKYDLNVPEVFFSCSNFFILEDCGERLKDFLKKPEIYNKIDYLKKAISSIANLHNLGFAHGGSQIRNFTIDNDNIFMIDFEEIIPEEYISDIQIRDVLIFLISLSNLEIEDEDYHALLKEYDKVSNNRFIYKKILNIVSRVKFLTKFYKTGFSKYLGKDIHDFIKLIYILNYN